MAAGDPITTSNPEPGDGSAEAARWVDDALANSREWFPDMPEAELRHPLEKAFELATSVGRGERDFHEVFEAELRRAVEEQQVFGAESSVLPARSDEAPKAFQATTPWPDVATPEPVAVSAEDDAERFVLAVGTMRFADGLTPEEIEAQLGIDADYYAGAMRWLLHRVDQGLVGDYPPHLDRDRMARFAAGLASNEDTFGVERHVRDCGGCATYLADLLDATVRAVRPTNGIEPGRLSEAAGPSAQAPPRVSFTHENAWIRAGEGSRRARREAPAMGLKADELRRYAAAEKQRIGESASAAAAAARAPQPAGRAGAERDTPPAARRASSGSPAYARATFSWRLRGLVALAIAATLVAVVAVLLPSLSGGDAQRGARSAIGAPSGRTPEPTTAPEAGEQAADEARRQAKLKEQRARAARREARRRLAARRRAAARRQQASRRRAAARRETQRESVTTPPEVPAPPPSSPPVTPSPPPAQSGPSDEFGLEP